jgi:hypothetical protein
LRGLRGRFLRGKLLTVNALLKHLPSCPDADNVAGSIVFSGTPQRVPLSASSYSFNEAAGVGIFGHASHLRRMLGLALELRKTEKRFTEP